MGIESENVEHKLSLGEWKAAVESVAAFATATGGVIRFGLAPDGRRVGVQIGANTLENLANDIKRNTDPPQFPSITFEGPESAAVVVVTVQVRIYDDRLEVWNPATMPYGLTVDALYEEHPSRPRNPLLAAAFHRARLIEHWGTGTLRMVQECEARRMPRPEFLFKMGMFIVRFRPGSAEGGAGAIPVPNLTGLSERQRKAVEYVLEHGSITVSVHRYLTGISLPQAKRDLAVLVQRGLLVRVGATRSSRYVLSARET